MVEILDGRYEKVYSSGMETKRLCLVKTAGSNLI